MNKRNGISILVIFCIAAFFLVVTVLTTRVHDAASIQIKLTLLGPTLGTLVALLSAVLLLIRAAAGSDLRDLYPLTIPLLAGVLIAGSHWSVPIVLGLLGITVLIREMVGTPAERRATSTPDA